MIKFVKFDSPYWKVLQGVSRQFPDYLWTLLRCWLSNPPQSAIFNHNNTPPCSRFCFLSGGLRAMIQYCMTPALDSVSFLEVSGPWYSTAWPLLKILFPFSRSPRHDTVLHDPCSRFCFLSGGLRAMIQYCMTPAQDSVSFLEVSAPWYSTA